MINTQLESEICGNERALVVDQLLWESGDSNPENGEYDFAEPYTGSDDTAEADLIEALSETKAFRRLEDIRFLGALDYFLVSRPNGKATSRRYTRQQHSLGVAALAKEYLDETRHSGPHRLVCVAAAMLHDVGHSPFSHTLEPVFTDAFGIDHHRASERIITGLAPLGDDVANVLKAFGVDPLAVLHVLNGGDEHFDRFFSGPINFDTIEGILRARSYLRMQKLGLSPLKVMRAAIARSNPESKHLIDGFWNSKAEVYSLVIRSKRGAFYDALFQEIARQHLDRLSADDFYTTETNIFRKIPMLRDVLDEQKMPTIARNVLPPKLAYSVRHFDIHQSVDFKTHADEKRYVQRKTRSFLTVEGILQGLTAVNADRVADERLCQDKGLFGAEAERASIGTSFVRSAWRACRNLWLLRSTRSS
jgi:predicted HD phosphohydrolase